MRCAVMQPTYLPWAGYFNLASKVDYFVFLDDVQFERRSWQSRNRIMNNGQELLLSVALRKHPRNIEIKDILLANEMRWTEKHWSSIKINYSKAAYGSEMLAILEEFYTTPHVKLSELNQKIIIKFFSLFNICAEIKISSLMQCEGVSAQRIFNITRALKCDEYLSPVGAKEYMTETVLSEINDIKVIFNDFNPKSYSQYNSKKFISHLSIIDIVANLGVVGAIKYLKQ
jgi:hypothetical protein